MVPRAVIASGLLGLLVGGAFVVLLVAISDLRASGRLATGAREELRAADVLEKLVIDLETGQRGFVITGEERFLEPWNAARAALPEQSARFVRFADDPAQTRRARRIAEAVNGYLRDYSLPLVAAARRNERSARSIATTDEGRRRVDALRAEFDRFAESERDLLTARQDDADDAARRAIVAGAAGLTGSILLILFVGGYLVRAIVLPVRRTSAAAGRLAGGDLSVRVEETGVGEIGALERAFNTMGSSLEASDAELRQLAGEQAALRRVATLVARGIPPSDVLDAVAEEASRLLDPDATGLLRYEPDGTATVVAGREVGGGPGKIGTRLTPGDDGIIGAVLRTGRAARVELSGDAASIPEWLRELGFRSGVGAPIVVEGRLWGVMIAGWTAGHQPPPDAEPRMTQFTELVATAIANAESRAELTASRARVVATADETRRRLERDLHDGAQQRLVHTVITLKLARRALADADGPAAELLEEALEHAERASTELRELAHGILPAILTRGGLRAGVEALVARVPVPVSVDIPAERLPPALEATAYFIVAEALTNVVKHAGARSAEVKAALDAGALRLTVRDDGAGGARIEGGSGLLGLRDRAAAMNGSLHLESPRDGGTVLVATLPMPAHSEESRR